MTLCGIWLHIVTAIPYSNILSKCYTIPGIVREICFLLYPKPLQPVFSEDSLWWEVVALGKEDLRVEHLNKIVERKWEEREKFIRELKAFFVCVRSSNFLLFSWFFSFSLWKYLIAGIILSYISLLTCKSISHCISHLPNSKADSLREMRKSTYIVGGRI